MFILKEKKAKKIPSITSLFISTENISKKMYDGLIQIPNSIYDSRAKEIEIPISKLIIAVDIITNFDDVKIESFEEKSNLFIQCDINKFKVKPYTYQIEGINYGLQHNSWLLLDDQGLGKSLQVIYLAEELKRRGEIQHCFIICGVNSLKYNWASEIAKFSDLSYTILGQVITKTGKVKTDTVENRLRKLKKGFSEFFIICNIETLQNKEFAKAFNSSKSKFDMVVVDEAHKVKEPSSLSAKTLLKLDAKYKVALTGTIIMNVPENAYVPLKWTGNIGSNYTQFKQMFNVYGGFGGHQVVGHKNLNILRDLISSCSLRRMKSEVLELPPKTYLTEYVELTNQQQQLYNKVQEGILAELDLLKKKPTIVEEITINMRLRQITACPSILSSEVTKSAKLDRLCDLVEGIVEQGDKVVVFNTFKTAAYKEFEMLGKFNPVICTGDQNGQELKDNVQRFQEDDNCKVLVGTWQKMGTGFTLTSASYLIFVDTPWTKAEFEQASDRIYRIGQKKPVFIITLVAKNTYDERVQEILEMKDGLSKYIIDNGDSSKVNILEE